MINNMTCPYHQIFLYTCVMEQFSVVLYKDPLSHFQKWINILLFWLLEIKFLWTEASTGTVTKAGHFSLVDKAWFCQYQLKERRKSIESDSSPKDQNSLNIYSPVLMWGWVNTKQTQNVSILLVSGATWRHFVFVLCSLFYILKLVTVHCNYTGFGWKAVFCWDSKSVLWTGDPHHPHISTGGRRYWVKLQFGVMYRFKVKLNSSIIIIHLILK